MPKYSLYLILIPILALLVYFFVLKNKQTKSINIFIDNKKYALEIAQTLTEKMTGLSNRQSLCQNCGMIFIYQKEGVYPFWMKNTYIPLDIIWLNKSGQVVDKKTGKPQDLTPLVNHTPAQYIIELNQNVTNIKIGDVLTIPKL